MTPIATSLAPSAHRFAHDQAPALHRHLQQCKKARGRWFGAAVLAERLHQVVAPRLATTVAIAGLALMVALQLL